MGRKLPLKTRKRDMKKAVRKSSTHAITEDFKELKELKEFVIHNAAEKKARCRSSALAEDYSDGNKYHSNKWLSASDIIIRESGIEQDKPDDHNEHHSEASIEDMYECDIIWCPENEKSLEAEVMPVSNDERGNKHDEVSVAEITEALIVQTVVGRTYLSAVIKDNGDPKNNSPSKNRHRHLRCHHGVAFSQGYVYDQNSDSYVVQGVDIFDVGFVSVAYQIIMPNTGGWCVRLPLPPSVIDRHLSSKQKRDLKTLREHYSPDRYSIEIFQMSGCET